VKRHLVAVLGSMEESYKHSKSGMKQRQYPRYDAEKDRELQRET
jgi:hypothetical protein